MSPNCLHEIDDIAVCIINERGCVYCFSIAQ